MNYTNNELFNDSGFMLRLGVCLEQYFKKSEDLNIRDLEKMIKEEFSPDFGSKSVAEDILKMKKFVDSNSPEHLESYLINKWYGSDKTSLLINDVISGKKDLSNLSSKEYKTIVNKFVQEKEKDLNYKQQALLLFFDIFNEIIQSYLETNTFETSTILQMEHFRENIEKFAIKLKFDLEKGDFS